MTCPQVDIKRIRRRKLMLYKSRELFARGDEIFAGEIG
jgi:hypothetical protein